MQQDTRPFLMSNETFDLCTSQDIIECVEYPEICGPNSNCTNLIGSYNCTCNSGYRLNDLKAIASAKNPCTGANYFSVSVCVLVSATC